MPHIHEREHDGKICHNGKSKTGILTLCQVFYTNLHQPTYCNLADHKSLS